MNSPHEPLTTTSANGNIHSFEEPQEVLNLLRRLYNACNPSAPATDQQYVDLSEARGSAALTSEIVKRLRFIEPQTPLRMLVCGHIGGGKSSELKHLETRLNDSARLINERRFFPVYLDADDYLNPYDADLPELLLAIAAQIGDSLERSRFSIKIEDDFFLNLLKNITDLPTQLNFKSELSASVLHGLATLKIALEPLKRVESARKLVRTALTKQTDTIQSEINRILARALLELNRSAISRNEPSFNGIVLIVDNLEKLNNFGGESNAEKAAYNLFVANGTTLTSFQAHLIYTVPMRATYAYPGDLSSRYGRPFSLPMVAVSRRDNPDQPYPKGRTCLEEMLQQRIRDVPLEVVFTRDALDWLLDMSGGHVRSLMIFAQSAIAETDDSLPIDLATARKATGPSLQLYSRSVPSSYFPLMAALHRSQNREIDESDLDFRVMLEQLMILEYRNGDENTDEESEPWYAINPIVRRLNGFKAALAVYDANPQAALVKIEAANTNN